MYIRNTRTLKGFNKLRVCKKGHRPGHSPSQDRYPWARWYVCRIIHWKLTDGVYRENGDDAPIFMHEDKVGAMGILMDQLSLKQGFHEWGEHGEAITIKEM